MSVEAMTWALAQPIQPSTAKFVLVVLAHCADSKEGLVWLSSTYLEKTTGQNRKTVLDGLRRLRKLRYIVDTGERKGETKSIVVYRLMFSHTTTEPSSKITHHTVDTPLSSPENGTASPMQAVPNSVPLSYPKNGTASVSLSSPENGTASHTQTQACPSTKVAPIEKDREQQQTKAKVTPKRSTARGSRLPADWVLPPEWRVWAQQERPDWTPDHIECIAARFRDHWLAKAGANARKVDWQATWRNWVRREPALSGVMQAKRQPSRAATAAERAAQYQRIAQLVYGDANDASR